MRIEDVGARLVIHGRFTHAISLLIFVACAYEAAAQQRLHETENFRLFELKSELLTDFWDKEMILRAAVMLPANFRKTERLPVCYVIHGFGGSHREAWSSPTLKRISDPDYNYPRLILVWLNSTFGAVHHIWADSDFMGPWGEALTTEFIPAIEKEFGACGKPVGRFLTGHSSGGHSSLWLQVAYPDYFGGVWSGAPDPVDFRNFIGIDVYRELNAYRAPDGSERMFIRPFNQERHTLRHFTLNTEFGRNQMYSFDAVFSPNGGGGHPKPLFDRTTGRIDPSVAQHWKRYDISLILRQNWAKLGPKLAGKLHIYCGTADTFRLNESLMLLEHELVKLGSDAEIVWVPGRDHNIFWPHPELYPNGLMERVNREMVEQFRAADRMPSAA